MKEELIQKMKELSLKEKINCKICNKSIDNPENEIKNKGNYYHKKCLKCFACLKESKEENLVDILDINSVKFKDGKILCKKHSLENKYTDNYFKPTLISTVAIPKFKEIKYKVKQNFFSDIIPQICLHFPISQQEAKIFLKNGGIEKIKQEIQTMLGDEFQVYLQSVEIGSIFAKFGILLKKAGAKIKKFFFGKNEEKTKIIEKTINIIRSNSFSSIKNPDAISFVNQSSFENNEQNKIKIQKFLKEKINKKEEDNTSIGSASTIASFPDKEITDEECEIQKILNEDENNLKEEIEVWEKHQF